MRCTGKLLLHIICRGVPELHMDSGRGYSDGIVYFLGALVSSPLHCLAHGDMHPAVQGLMTLTARRKRESNEQQADSQDHLAIRECTILSPVIAGLTGACDWNAGAEGADQEAEVREDQREEDGDAH